MDLKKGGDICTCPVQQYINASLFLHNPINSNNNKPQIFWVISWEIRLHPANTNCIHLIRDFLPVDVVSLYQPWLFLWLDACICSDDFGTKSWPESIIFPIRYMNFKGGMRCNHTWVGVKWIRPARCSLSGADKYFCCLKRLSSS